MTERTAIIKKIKIGMVDHYKDIMMSCTFDMDGLGCVLDFTMEQAQQMMKDVKLYDDVFGLIGKPCQVEGDWGSTCKFIRMWKS